MATPIKQVKLDDLIKKFLGQLSNNVHQYVRKSTIDVP